MSRIACILNPKARDGLSVKQWALFENCLLEAGYEDCQETAELAIMIFNDRALCQNHFLHRKALVMSFF